MERDARYAAVGAFVLLVITMAVLFVYWYQESHERRDYTRYEIYFEGSVSGLARGAPVRYLGVDVGRVVRMRIDPRNSGRVEVVVDIDSSAPVSMTTVAELSLQGITGLLYIDLIVNAAERRVALVQSLEYPVIRSARSNFDVFLASLPGLVSVFGDVAGRVTRVLSDANITAMHDALGNISQASGRVPSALHEIQALTADLRTTAAQIGAAAAGVRSITDQASPELMAALQRVRVVADNLARTSGKLDQLVQDNRDDVRAFARDGLPELERLLLDGRAAAVEFRELSHDLRENPSRLLYQPQPQGVEIPP